MLFTLETAEKLYLHGNRFDDKGKATKEEIEYAIRYDSDWFELTGQHVFENYEELRDRLEKYE